MNTAENNMDEALYEKVYNKFVQMLENRKTPSQLRAPETPPAWLDKDSCRKGREYYFSSAAACSISSMEALLLGFCIPNFYKPLIVSRKSHMKEDATTRYMETAALVYSWYLSDAWEKEGLASVMIRRVNAMHRFVANKVRPIHTTIGKNVDEVFKDSDVDVEAELTFQDKILLTELAEIREKTNIPKEYYDYVDDSIAFSQTDMTLVQGAFFGHLMLFPEHYGAKDVTVEEMKNFLHFWRTNGYYLGVSDENNAVLPDYEETKIMAELVLHKILVPCMLHLNPEAMHMARAALFPGMDYHVVLYSKYELVGIPLPKLWNSLSLWQKSQYYFRQLYIPHIYPLPGVKQTINFFAKLTLGNILQNYQKKGKSPKTSD